MKNLFAMIAMLVGFASFGQDSTWVKAEKAYSNGQFEYASELYSAFIEHHHSGEAYYNRGNAHFRSESLGLAIADWKKAKKLNPSLTDVDHNLEIARSQVIDQLEAAENPGWYAVLSAVLSGFGSSNWIILGIVLLIVSILLTIPYLKNTSKRVSLVIGGLLFLGGWVFQGFAWMSYRIENQKEMVIISENVYVKNEPNLQANDLFILHEGVEGDVLSVRNGWVKIRLGDGKIGWVEIDEVTII